MTLEAEMKLSYYKEVANIDAEGKAKLVQHTENEKFYVLKAYTTYDIQVYDYLANNRARGVSKIAELIEDDGVLYVIEEYITGKSMQELLDSEGHFSKEKAAGYIDRLCDILAPLHKLNKPVIHRDIKPSNLIVTSDDDLILVDFNAAKESEGDKSQDTVLIGTPGYAAPEQYGFGISKPTADIYAIGVLLNELLTGKLPKEEKYSGELWTVIEKCVQMEPSSRYQSVEELQNAIKGGSKKPKKLHGLRSWLPPGIGSKKPLVVVLSSLWYVFMIYMSVSPGLENFEGIDNIIVSRIVYFAILLAETLLIGNYRNIRAYLPICKSEKKSTRVWGIIVWSFVIFSVVAIIIMIISDIFYAQV